MVSLDKFLREENGDFNSSLGLDGGYLEFSNSGRRGDSKSFHIGLQAIYQTLQDIKQNLGIFEHLDHYVEGEWRDNGARYFTNNVAKAMITVQTKPLFCTLSKLIKWSNPTLYKDIDPEQKIILNESSLDQTLINLSRVIKMNTLRLPVSPSQNEPLQLIYFGTPGSGKSYKVQESLKGVPEDNVFRTTFHPDSDYASFVGCYKPIVHQGLGRKPLSKAELEAKFRKYKQTNQGYVLHRFCATHPEIGDLSKAEKEGFLAAVNESSNNYVEILKAVACAKEVSKSMQNSDITYEFTPQVFTNAYVQAWKKQAEAVEQKKQAEKVYIVIEEINRGNCAQIFGDLFQLLDRKEDGTSTYKIRADQDLANYLMKELGEQHPAIAGGNLRLPTNLHIIATMNTSDQSLFPMDSAFKRRWDWEYVPIDYRENVNSGKFEISIGDKKDKKTYHWVDFLKAVNERILTSTDSEDKQMGNFFIKHSVEEKEFKSKVMFYLWHEVCKDEYHTKNNFFRTIIGDEEKEFSFNELHEENGTDILVGFMQYLGVKPLEEKPSQDEAANPIDTNGENVEE
jgi:type II restriction-modification system restriction subunit